jgi:hypothetical protein
MPRKIDQLPADATTIARRIAALERQVRELRAAKRAAYTAISGGSVKILDGSGDLVAEATADGFFGEAAFATYGTFLGEAFYAALTSGQLAFGINPTSDQQAAPVPGGIAFSDLGSQLELQVYSGTKNGTSATQINLYSSTTPTSADASLDIVADQVTVYGKLSARNIAAGSVTVTPSAANTPTSIMVNGLTLAGSTVQVVATAATTLPGTQVTGIGITNATTNSFTLWLTRTNTSPTAVSWMAISQ